MLKNIIKTSIRNLKRFKVYTFTNILGLTLGISCALVIYRLVTYELSFDRYHYEANNIFRVINDAQQGTRLNRTAAVPHPFADAMKQDLSGLEEVLKVHNLNVGIVSYDSGNKEQIRIEEENSIVFTRSNFFKLFDYKWLAGSSPEVIDQPGIGIITRDKAKLLFGLTDYNLASAIGEVVKINDKLSFTIQGVVENPPSNTDFPFHYFIHYESLDGFLGFYKGGENWRSTSRSTNCFVTLNADTDPSDIEAQLPDFIKKYKGDELAKNDHYRLQPLSDIHFNENYENYNGRTVDKVMIRGLILIGIFIVLIACINFVNLSTSLISARLKEVGIRKVLGSSKRMLITQYVTESVLITLLSALASLGVAEFILINLQQIIGYQIGLGILSQFSHILFLMVLVVAVSLLSGLYPAMTFSRFNSLDAIKGKGSNATSNKFLIRKGLVVFQFVITQALIIATIVVMSQLNYFQNKDLGFDKESVLMVKVPDAKNLNAEVFKAELKKYSSIVNVTFGMSAPQSASNGNVPWNYTPLGLEQGMITNIKSVDAEYFDLFDLEVIAGRALRNDDKPNQIVVNEKIVGLMELESPEDAIGKNIQVSMLGGDAMIVGVVKDFHLLSLKEKIPSSILFNFPDYYYSAAIKFSPLSDDRQELLSHVEKVWLAQFPKQTFDYEFLETQLESFYTEESRLLTVIQGFAGIAIFIGCLGLYGLVYFMTNQKVKEIGVRKVLGASTGQILGIFINELVWLIGIAFVLAIPIGYYFMDSWLSNFEYRINLSLWVFVAALGFTFVIALITTGFRSLKSANTNPVDSLRSE